MVDIFPLSLFFCYVLWAANKYLKFEWLKNIRSSPQTFHKKSTSRLGGTAVYLSLLITTAFFDQSQNYDFLRTALLCSFPVFLTGLLDDLKIDMKPILRIILMVPSPILFFYLLDIRVESVSINFLDFLLQQELIALAFLIFAIIGIINAFNIIDGFNGLLLSYALTILVSLILGYEDANGMNWLTYMVAIFFAVLAVFIVNFPFGKIFLGDAGAYLIGALIPVGLIKYTFDNDFSPWFVLAILIYPVTEVMVSIIRKVLIRRRSALEPDGLHFHMLVYKKITKRIGFKRIKQRHFLVTLIILIFNFPFMLLANYFKTETLILVLICFWYVLAYLAVYFILFPKHIFKAK